MKTDSKKQAVFFRKFWTFFFVFNGKLKFRNSTMMVHLDKLQWMTIRKS